MGMSFSNDSTQNRNIGKSDKNKKYNTFEQYSNDKAMKIFKRKAYELKEIKKMKTIKIKAHTEDLVLPQKFEHGDWIDLRSAEDVELKFGEYKLISLGISMQLPKGYEAHVVPRSSTFKNFGVIQSNNFGVIDNSYCGNEDVWRFPAICMTEKAIIKKNDRICQFRIVKKQEEIEFEQVDNLENENRGGIGSTGVN